jgi:hypothetical protein
MLISRKLAHKLTDRLQVIVSAIELGEARKAIVYALDMAQLIHRHTESEDEEKARQKREAAE